jgi:hypothetical protein
LCTQTLPSNPYPSWSQAQPARQQHGSHDSPACHKQKCATSGTLSHPPSPPPLVNQQDDG